MAVQDPPKDTPGDGDDSWSTYSPPVSQPVPETPAEPDTAETLPPTHVPYGTYPPAPGSTGVTVVTSKLVSTRRSGCAIAGLIIVLAVFLPTIFGIIAGVKAISGGFDELEDGLGSPFSGADKPNVQSAAGFEDLLDALRAETGSTTVFDAVIYPDYAVLSVPADKSSKRYHSYYFDGELRQTSQGITEDTRFDLSTIDSAVLVKLIKKARTDLVEDPTSVYAIISQPGEFDNGAWFSVYASNSYTESGYFQADKTGKVVFE